MEYSKHLAICKEFIILLRQTKRSTFGTIMNTSFINLINKKKYYHIFSYDMQGTNIAQPLLHYIVTCISPKALMHVALSRKITNIGDRWITVIATELNTKFKCDKFFSFYNAVEVKRILIYNVYNEIMTYNNSYIKTTLLFQCLKSTNRVLFHYLLQYMDSHNMSSMVSLCYNSTDHVEYSGIKLLQFCGLNTELIDDHESVVLYRRSLRNAWIISVIIIDYLL